METPSNRYLTRIEIAEKYHITPSAVTNRIRRFLEEEWMDKEEIYSDDKKINLRLFEEYSGRLKLNYARNNPKNKYWFNGTNSCSPLPEIILRMYGLTAVPNLMSNP